MAHCNTILHQMLKFIPRHVYDKLDREHGTGRSARSFTRWYQCIHLLFMQLSGRCSLRDGVASLKARFKNLYHLGVKQVACSTGGAVVTKDVPGFAVVGGNPANVIKFHKKT